MKKIKPFLLSAALFSLGALTLVSCGDLGGNIIGGGTSSGKPSSNEPSTSVHTCEFTQEDIQEKYLKDAATCETKAVYYYSCACGEKGSETFEYGEALGHDYAPSYEWVGNECNLVFTCKNDETHIITEAMEVTTQVSDPTCEEDGSVLYTATLEYEGNTYTDSKTDIGETKLGHDYQASYAWEENECTLTLTCKNDETHVVTEAMTVTSGVITDPTCTTLGVRLYTATYEYEGETYISTLEVDEPKVPHTYVDKYCSVCGEREYSDGLEFELSEDETYYEVIGMGECTDTELWIPKTHNDLPVKKIRQNAFANQTTLTIVVVPDSVVEIGVAAFYGCSSIEKMEIPFVGMRNDDNTTDGVNLFGVIFGNSYFDGATKTEQCYDGLHYRTFYIPTSLTEVVVTGGTFKGAEFYQCQNIINVVVTAELTELPKSSFFNCPKLKSVTLPDTVELIGDYAFGLCKSLESFKVPANVTEIGASAFSACEKLTSVEFNEKLLTIKGSAFNGCELLDNVILPEGLTTISNDAFEQCYKLKEIILPSTLEVIGWRAFYMCTSLEDIKIPEGVKEIMSEAFAYCTSLQYFTAPDNSKIGKNLLSNCTSLVHVSLPYLELLTGISNGIEYEHTYLGYYFGAENYAQHGSKLPTTLISIRIASGKIYARSFDGMNLVKIILGKDLEYVVLGLSASDCVVFEGTENDWAKLNKSVTNYAPHFYFTSESNELYELETLVIDDGLEVIDEGSFYDMDSLINVTIPASVKEVKHAAFYSQNIKNVYYLGTIEDWLKIDFEDITSTPMYYGEHFFLLDENNEWVEVTELVIPGTVKEIGYQFASFDNVTSITIEEGVETIGERAFYNSRLLEEIVIPTSVTSIGHGALMKCIAIKSITIPFVGDSIKTNDAEVKYPLGYIFGDIGNNIDTDNDLCYSQKYNTYTFYDIPKTLESVTVTGGNILTNSFQDIKIKTLIIGDGVGNIYESAFNKMMYLENLTIPFVGTAKENVSNYYPLGWMFGTVSNSGDVYGVRQNIEYVNQNGEITGVSSEILYQVPNTLRNVTVNGGYISGYAFKNCSKLTSVTLADGCTGMGVDTFRYCSDLETIFFSNTITNISVSSFFGCAAGKTLSLYFYGTRTEMYALIDGKEVINSSVKYAYSEVNPYENPADPLDIYYNFWHYDEEGNIVVWEKPAQ